MGHALLIRATALCAALAPALLPRLAAAQGGTPALMSPGWAEAACQAWNAEPALTDELVKSGWAGNDAKRGFKVIQIYRSDCADSPRVELRIAERSGKARCTYGGKLETAKLDASADYLMYAETARWEEMGRGEYGAMRAMALNRLQFDGPVLEAMRNMGPFENFLLLVGKVPGGTACPPR